jgi:hypothetical protein
LKSLDDKELKNLKDILGNYEKIQFQMKDKIGNMDRPQINIVEIMKL